MMDITSFFLSGPDGDSRQYDILFTFENDASKESYIVFTDHERLPGQPINVYANRFDPDNGRLSLLPIETQEEWDLVESVLKTLYHDGDLDSVGTLGDDLEDAEISAKRLS